MSMIPKAPSKTPRAKALEVRPIDIFRYVEVPSIVPPAFWERPAWLNDSRDNPRDPNFEPFWMRDPVEDASSEVVGTGTLTITPILSGNHKVTGYLYDGGYIDPEKEKKAKQVQSRVIGEDRVYNCPECGGLGVPYSAGRFRCRTGHHWNVVTGNTRRNGKADEISRREWNKRLSDYWDAESALPLPPKIDDSPAEPWSATYE